MDVHEIHYSQKTKNLSGKRLLVCGKGGCGKSTVVTILARTLNKRGYGVLVLDGDASNPGGLARLLFGLQKGPKPLIDFFGGREKVECPVDNPDVLTRINDPIPITEHFLDLTEIPPEYYHQLEGIILFQVGKIQRSCEGCDGPMSKVSRDFIVSGDRVMLIDVEAGIEHYGRGIEKNVDCVIVVADPTYESFLIAERVLKLSSELGIKNTGVVLNKVESKEMQLAMRYELEKRKATILGIIKRNSEFFEAGLKGISLKKDSAIKDGEKIIDSLEEAIQEDHIIIA